MAHLYSRERSEDEVFVSLDKEERSRYFDAYRSNRGDVRGALDQVLGENWYDRDGFPKGHRFRGQNER